MRLGLISSSKAGMTMLKYFGREMSAGGASVTLANPSRALIGGSERPKKRVNFSQIDEETCSPVSSCSMTDINKPDTPPGLRSWEERAIERGLIAHAAPEPAAAPCSADRYMMDLSGLRLEKCQLPLSGTNNVNPSHEWLTCSKAAMAHGTLRLYATSTQAGYNAGKVGVRRFEASCSLGERKLCLDVDG